MAHIAFYEKPGCINNTKQKRWLTAAGHEVTAINIMEHEWSREKLEKFFGNRPIASCFNSTAPAIKSGELNPEDFSYDAALDMMIAQPILIKRPLMAIDQTHYLQGFDKDRLHSLIGLDAKAGAEETVKELEQSDLTICPKLNEETSCDDETDQNKSIRPLGELIQLAQEMSLDVTYVYDDLVFIEHNAFMFQFLDNGIIALFFNQECPEADAKRIESQILLLGRQKNLTIKKKGTFTMKQKEGEENLDIEFFTSSQ